MYENFVDIHKLFSRQNFCVMSMLLTQFSAMAALCRTSDLTLSLTNWATLTEASLEGALADDRDVGHFVFQQRGLSRVLGRLLLESCRH